MLVVLILFTTYSIIGFKGEFTIEGKNVTGDDSISTVECPPNSTISKCQYEGHSDGTYVEETFCQSRGSVSLKKHRPIVTCIPVKNYKTMVIKEIVVKEGNITCPSNTELSDCRLYHNWDPYHRNTKKIENNSCFVGTKLVKDFLIHINLEVTCVEKIDSYISGFKKRDINGQISSIGVCPTGHSIKSCKCEDIEKCESTQVLNNICRVTYIHNSDEAKAKIGCVHNEDLTTMVQSPNEAIDSGDHISGCTIQPKNCSKRSFKSIHDKLDEKCKLSTPSDCHVVKAISIVNKAKSVIISKSLWIKCPEQTKVIHCYASFGTASYHNNGCARNNGTEKIMAICYVRKGSEIPDRVESPTDVIPFENINAIGKYFSEIVEITFNPKSRCPNNYKLISCVCSSPYDTNCYGVIPYQSSCIVLTKNLDSIGILTCGKLKNDKMNILISKELVFAGQTSASGDPIGNDILLSCSLYSMENQPPTIYHQATMISNHCELLKKSPMMHLVSGIYLRV